MGLISPVDIINARYQASLDERYLARYREIGPAVLDELQTYRASVPANETSFVDQTIQLIKLIQGCVPEVKLPAKSYDVILSSSLLHHLHAAQALWDTIQRCSKPGTLVFVVDLRRPMTRVAAERLAKKYAAGEPAILKRDFFNSLLAAFTPGEVRRQLRAAGLNWLRVKSITDRHLMVSGQYLPERVD